MKLISAEQAEHSTNIEPESVEKSPSRCGNQSDRWPTNRYATQLKSPIASVLPDRDSIRKCYESITRTPSVDPLLPTEQEILHKQLVAKILEQKEIKTYDFLQSLIRPELAITRVFIPHQMKREEVLQRGHPLERAVERQVSTTADEVNHSGEKSSQGNDSSEKKRNRSLRSKSQKKYIK